jgi:methyl-accepting chemotaxis protein
MNLSLKKMKLSTKLVFTVSCIVLLSFIVNMTVIYFQNKKIMINNGQQQALTIIKTFESRLSSTVTVEELQKSLDLLKAALELGIMEFNIYKIDGDNAKVVASFSADNIGKQADPEDLEAAKSDKIVPIIDNDIVDVTAPLHVQDQVAYVAGVKFSVQDDLKTIVSLIVYSGIITLILAVALLKIISHLLITRPLKELIGMSTAISSGDLSRDYSSIDVSKKDEIGQLVASFVQMALILKDLILQLTESTKHLSASSFELTAVSQKSTDSSTQISVAIREISMGSETQLQGAEQTSRVMEEMANGVQRIAESSAVVSTVALDVANEVQKGYEEVSSALRQMEFIREATHQSSVAINEMNKHSEKIGQFVNVITEITNQTQILALNAAIEAARAGEHGKGFSIVATEVKKLAEQTQKATTAITEIIQEIQTSTKDAVTSMNTGVAEVETGTHIMNKTEQIFNHLLTAIKHVTDQIQEVSAASEQMSAGTEEVSASTQETVSLAKKVAASIQEVSTSAAEQLASMNEVAASAESLNNLAQQLQGVIERVKA